MTALQTIWRILNKPIWQPPSREELVTRAASGVLRLVQQKRGTLHQEHDELVRRIMVAARHGDSQRVANLAQQLEKVVEEEQYLDGLLPPVVRSTHQTLAPNEYVFSTRMLAGSFRYCTQTPDEGAHFIAGVEVDGKGVGTELIPFPYAYQSVAGAAGDHRATHEICIDMHESGHRLMALMHSHPGTGMHANHHSSTDARTHRLWEKTTRIIGGIWDRSGYLRFFSEGLPFRVVITGKGMKEVDKDVWQLEYPFAESADQGDMEMQAAEVGGCGD